jgi:hypothetical protein
MKYKSLEIYVYLTMYVLILSVFKCCLVEYILPFVLTTDLNSVE